DYPLPGESLFSEYPQKDRFWQYMEYSQNNRRWISIRNKVFKYNYYYGGGFEQLFDMANDPYETSNLLHEEVNDEVEATRNVMRNKLLEYEREWGLEGYVGEDDFKIGEPYQPHPQRNEAFPRFPFKLTSETEKAQMNNFIDEIAAAVADEPLVRIKNLDIIAWQKNLQISNEDVKRLLTMDDQKSTDLSSDQVD
ncbi:unnamed protein product, partial [marine sediment metagenome]